MASGGLKDLLRRVVGDFRWAPPAWMQSAGDLGRQLTALIRADPRRSAGILAAVLLVVLASVLGWRWYQSLPKPVEYTVAVTPPDRTCIECDPPGKPNAVVLRFSGSVAPLELSGKVLDAAKAGVSIRPEIPGE